VKFKIVLKNLKPFHKNVLILAFVVPQHVTFTVLVALLRVYYCRCRRLSCTLWDCDNSLFHV